MRVSPKLGIVLAAALLMAGCEWEDLGPSNRFKEAFSYQFEMKPGGRIDLESFNGPVEVYGWDKNEVQVQGEKYASTEENLAAMKIDITPSPELLRVRTVRPSGRRGNMGAKYVIHAPRRTSLDKIVSSNGSIRVEDIEGQARLSTSNGGLRVTRLKGDLDGTTSNGGVNLQGLTGAASVRTSNGGIQVDGVRGRFDATTSNGGVDVRLSDIEAGNPARIRTSNGSINLTLDRAAADVIATTSNGGITVRMPASVNARVKAHTSNARISTDFAVNATGEMGKSRLEGTIGSGGPTLDLSTSNGSIRLTKN
jgi:hypothetical protein